MTSDTPPRTLLIAFAAIYLIWGSTYLGIRVAVESLPPFAMASLRFALAGTILLGYLFARGRLQLKRQHLWDNALTGALLLLGGNGAVSWAEQYLSSGLTALIVSIQPLVMVTLEWVWKRAEGPSTRLLLALCLGFGGTVLLVAPWDNSGEGSRHPLALAALMAATLFWALGSLRNRHLRDPADPFVAAGLQMIFGALFLALSALVRGEWQHWEPTLTSARSWLALAYLTVFGSLIAFTCFVWLMKHCKPALVATYAYVNPVIAVILGWLLLDEAISARMVIAAVIVIGSVVAVSLLQKRRKPSG